VLEAPNRNSYTQISPREGYCIARLIFDNLLYERAIAAGCISRTQSISNIEQHPDLLNEFDYIIDARGVSAGEPNVIAIRAYWTIRTEEFPGQKPSKLQVYFDEMLGTHGYAWVFPVAFQAGSLKLNVGVIVLT
jgi:flavin-dependent dehydrogenase